MTQEFDKILTDARGIKKTLVKLEEAEVIFINKINFTLEKLRRNWRIDREYIITRKLIDRKNRRFQIEISKSGNFKWW